MGKFMEHATSVMKQYADKVAFLNEKREMTHGELDRESGQIYAWLKKQGIGREDFVQIVLPRGPECIAALMGVLRAGAAFLISEKGYPEKRIEFMRRDAGAKIVLEEDTYRQILREEEPLPGYEETSPHDAAFACYTSGSTGTPKGILHEYGTLDLMQHTVPLETSYGDNPHMLVTSMSFILSFVDIVNAFHYLRPMYIVSSEMLRDVTAMSRLMEEKQAYSSTMSPSYWRLCNKPGLPLKKVIVAGEPARGIYHEGENLVIRNFYSLTEAACCILGMELDRPYEDAPLGMPIIDALDVHLENPDGSRVEGPGEGELCLNNTYMRCYINLPEKTQEIIRNGVFHTGDIARRMEDGTYFLIGRKDDMFKINGNRVEPGEIEGAVQKITGLKTVVAKGFDVEGRSFICLYYLRSEAVERNLLDGENLKADISALSEMLPRYMLPTYYIPLEKMPLNDSGKIARRLLSAPELKDVAGE
ncbi:MAG: AMP-binding protein, partial [Selenomonadaceae bacterium]|nr:AMP-binding protein [Selenomonadaceae bacterium]